MIQINIVQEVGSSELGCCTEGVHHQVLILQLHNAAELDKLKLYISNKFLSKIRIFKVAL
jgi:hypothetical protein